MKLFQKRRVIEREGGDTYMIRWNILSSKILDIKLHKILLSDYDCLHDHPWSFLSIILWGGYYEYAQCWGDIEILENGWHQEGYIRKKWYRPGSILWRPAKYTHKLEIPKGKYALTLVFTFKRVREWGFWTPKGWMPWFNYLNSRDGGCQ